MRTKKQTVIEPDLTISQPKAKRGRPFRKTQQQATDPNTTIPNVSAEDYLRLVMLNPEVGADRRDAAAKALLKAEMQRENARTVRMNQGIGKKEAQQKAAEEIMSATKGKEGGMWSEILNRTQIN